MNVGNKIKAVSFTDCFGVFQPEILGLTVESVTTIAAAHGVAAYDRILAIDEAGYPRVEGAERYFEAVPS